MIIKKMLFCIRSKNPTKSNWKKDERKMLFEKCKGSQILLCVQIPLRTFLCVQSLLFKENNNTFLSTFTLTKGDPQVMTR